MTNDKWIVRDKERGVEVEVDSRAEAEERMQDMEQLGADVEIDAPGVTTADKSSVTDPQYDDGDDESDDVSEATHPTDGGTEPDVVKLEHSEADLPEEQPSVSEDPMSWIPKDFIDVIDGSPAINRKGYDVIAHHYGISVTTEVLVSPVETGHEYAEVKAVAVTKDGIEYSAHGSAHLSRGDDSHLLLEMADTRAAKRATARASGVGMVAVQELQNEL